METPQAEVAVPQEQEEKKKRSPWIVVLIIFLVITMCCCLTGVVLCRGGAMLPDFLEGYLQDVPGLEDGTYDFWSLIEEILEEFDFNSEDFLPEDFEMPDMPESE